LVEKDIRGSRLHQSSSGDLAKDRHDALKLLYQLNPVLSEALFAKQVVLVEGDTEFSAVSRVLAVHGISVELLNVHVVQCGGKGSLPAFQRVLREFGKKYLVVHDLDVTHSDRHRDIKAWEKNEAIWSEVEQARASGIDALGFVFNLDFERAHNYEKKKPAIAAAIQFIDAAFADGSLSNYPLHDLLEAVKQWRSPLVSLDDVKKLTSG
jgi:predicted ATP-dependent endonuclease of OLD family